jgi:hypothetical protein
MLVKLEKYLSPPSDTPACHGSSSRLVQAGLHTRQVGRAYSCIKLISSTVVRKSSSSSLFFSRRATLYTTSWPTHTTSRPINSQQLLNTCRPALLFSALTTKNTGSDRQPTTESKGTTHAKRRPGHRQAQGGEQCA